MHSAHACTSLETMMSVFICDSYQHCRHHVFFVAFISFSAAALFVLQVVRAIHQLKQGTSNEVSFEWSVRVELEE